MEVCAPGRSDAQNSALGGRPYPRVLTRARRAELSEAESEFLPWSLPLLYAGDRVRHSRVRTAVCARPPPLFNGLQITAPSFERPRPAELRGRNPTSGLKGKDANKSAAARRFSLRVSRTDSLALLEPSQISP